MDTNTSRESSLKYNLGEEEGAGSGIVGEQPTITMAATNDKTEKKHLCMKVVHKAVNTTNKGIHGLT